MRFIWLLTNWACDVLIYLLLLARCRHALRKYVHSAERCTENWSRSLCCLGLYCTYLLTYLLSHGAEPFLRSRQLCSHSRTSQHFMEPEGLLPCSQEPSTGPYPIHNIPSYLRSTLILSTHLRPGLPSGLFPSGFFPFKIRRAMYSIIKFYKVENKNSLKIYLIRM
jgi:hypothetical protein